MHMVYSSKLEMVGSIEQTANLGFLSGSSFDLFCGANYPHQPPEIKCSTTMGLEGLNPNLHADGTGEPLVYKG